MNSVIDERSLTASMPPKIASAVAAGVASTGPAHSRRRAPRTGWARYARLVERCDRVEPRHLAPPEARDLREHEPHPVPGLAAGAELGEDAVVDVLLGDDEALAGRHPRPDCRGTLVAMSLDVVTGLLLIVVPILFNVAFFALGQAFDYPDILRREPDEILRRFHAGGTGLLLRWHLLLLSALAMVPWRCSSRGVPGGGGRADVDGARRRGPGRPRAGARPPPLDLCRA